MYISDNAELAENKLSLLYISECAGLPLTNSRLTQIVTDGKLFNFFLLQHLLEDLLNNAYFKKGETPEGEATYMITSKGTETLRFLIHKLPKGVRKHIERLTYSKSDIIRKDRDISSYFIPDDNDGFISVLEIKDNGELLFSVKYSSATKKDAIDISNKLKDKAQIIYDKITKEIIV